MGRSVITVSRTALMFGKFPLELTTRKFDPNISNKFSFARKKTCRIFSMYVCLHTEDYY